MKFSGLKKYLGIFILSVAIIAVYKTFDNFNGVISFFRTLMNLLTPFFISFGIAYLLYPISRRIEEWLGRSKHKFVTNRRRSISVLSVYIIVLLVLSGVASFIVPRAAKSIADFIAFLPTLLSSIIGFLQDFDFYGLNARVLFEGITPEKLLDKFEFTSVTKYLSGVINFSSSILDIVMGVIISIYILLDRHNLKAATVRVARLFIRPKAMSFIKKYVRSINKFVYKYIVCQFTDALIVFVLCLILFSLMRIKYAPVLAALIGICNLIPYFGALIAGVVTVVVTFFTMSPIMALWVGIAVVVLQQIDSNVINPAIVKDQLDVKPFWVILGILLGGGFFGIFGIFFAAPVMALLKIMLNDFLTMKENSRTEPEELLQEDTPS